MTAYPLLLPGAPDRVFAWRGEQALSTARFLSEARALANLLPARGHVANLCDDRYHFTVGLAAALLRGQVTLLPPGGAPGILAQLAADYPGLYCLTDDGVPTVDLPAFTYPRSLAAPETSGGIPLIPSSQPAVVLFTSGSTGQPRPHGRSWGALVRGSEAAGQRLGVAGLPGLTLVGTVPHQHSYGLESTVMLALRHGIAFRAERPLLPSDVCAALEAAPRPRLLVTTPIHLRALLADPAALPAVDLILSATAPLAADPARQAEARFGGALHEIYGCSEAGQVATRRTTATEDWQCLDGIALRQDDQGTWAFGAALDRETLLNDAIDLRDATRFTLRGRLADLVNIAGKRGSLAHLTYQLTAIPGVRDGVFVMPEAESGATPRLMAFAVAPGLSADAIMSELRKHIDPAFLPRPLCLVEALPRNALGKLPREDVTRLAAARR